MFRSRSDVDKETSISTTVRMAASFSMLTLRRVGILASAMFVIFLSLSLSQAQSIQYTQNKPDKALRSAMRVDPSTLGLSINVPIAAYPGRGDASLPVTLSYSSKQWRVDYFDSYMTVLESIRTSSFPKFSEWAKAGWTSSMDIPVIEYLAPSQPYESNGTPYSGANYQSPYYINRILVHMPGGSSHELRIDDTPSTTQIFTGTFYAVDSSNIRYEATSAAEGTLYLPDGSHYLLSYSTSSYQYQDRNGNTLFYNASNRQWTDTQDRVLGMTLPDSPSAATYTYSLPSTTSTPFSYSVRWSTLANALTNSGDSLRYISNMTQSGPGDSFTLRSPSLFQGTDMDRLYGQVELFNPIVLAEIILPNGQHYSFTYNVWGEITKVVYPTGGYECFEYAPVPGVGYMRAYYAQANRGVVHRWLSPSGNGGDELHWNYEAVANSNVLTVKTTAPDASLTEHLMTAETSEQSSYFGFSNPALGTSFEDRLKAPDGTLLRRTLTNWSSAIGPTGAPRNPRITKQVNILLEPETDNALTSMITMSYDDYLNVIAKKYYDFTSMSKSSAETLGIASFSEDPLLLLRTDETTFLVNDTTISSTTRDAYRNRNLLSLPTSTRVRNGSNTIVAQTRTRYDNVEENGSPGPYPLLTYSGYISNWGDPGNIRGLPTTNGVWLNTSNSYLDAHAQYDQFGNLRNSWDAAGNQSQMSYSAAYSYAYPTSAKTAVPDPSGVYGSASALTVTAEYNANTGLMTSLTDYNGQRTTYSYDAINQLATTTQPNGATVTYIYSDIPNDLYQGVLTQEDSSRFIETRKYFDGLGRPTRSFLYDGTTSTPWLVSDTYYDTMGRVWKASNPYRVNSPGGSLPATCAACTTNGYDALGRLLTVTTPDGAQFVTNYGASTSGTLAATTTVTDQALRKRRSLIDVLGRLVRVDEPNKDTGSLDVGGASTFYTYNIFGNLLRVDQDSQRRFFVYDSLGRLLRVKNPEQGNFSPNPDEGFPALNDSSSGVSS